MSATDVAVLFPFKYNHELAEILVAGKPCKKAVVHAQQGESDNGGRKLFEINEKGECIKPKWAMVASQTARRTCITNMYLARKPDGSSKYTLAERMSVSGHKSESQYIKYIRCSLDEVAEMVAAVNDKDGDNLF